MDDAKFDWFAQNVRDRSQRQHISTCNHSWVKITRKQHLFCLCPACEPMQKCIVCILTRFFYFHRTFSPLRQRISFFAKSTQTISRPLNEMMFDTATMR